MPDITGTYIEGGAGPIAGWRVELWGLDTGSGWHPTPSDATTSADGSFTLSVPTMVGVSGVSLGKLTVEVRLVDWVGRVVHRSKFRLPLIGAQALGTILVHSNNVRGYLATNLDPGGVAMRLSTNNSVEPLIDNEAAWAALHEAITKTAKHEILLQLFYFDVNYVFLTFPPKQPSIGSPTVGSRLEEDLLAANRDRGITVRLLIRDHNPLPYPVHTADPVIAYFATVAPASTIEVRRFNTDIRLPMHAKFVVIDGSEAHLTASPLLQEYFDGSRHFIDDPRRGPLSQISEAALELAMMLTPHFPEPDLVVSSFKQALKNAARVPVHDVGMRIRGGAVDALKETFFDHWNITGAPASSSLSSTAGDGPTSSVQIVRSLPRTTFPLWPEGEASILESYLRCFSHATHFLYLENQYLTELLIYDAIRLALKAKPGLQVIMLINHRVDIKPYQSWQTSRLLQLKRNLTDDGTIDQFGVFTLWSHDDTVKPQRIISNYVHTKAGIADDNWATIGSANLDGTSLSTSEHLMSNLVLQGQENLRSIEVNATIFDGVDGQGPSSVPGDLRRALWAEHLGLGSTDPLLTTMPDKKKGGWLSLWKSRAEAKLASLKGTSISHPCRVLEWMPEENPKAYLKALGVDVRLQFEVLEEFKGFDFTTGKWQ